MSEWQRKGNWKFTLSLLKYNALIRRISDGAVQTKKANSNPVFRVEGVQ